MTLGHHSNIALADRVAGLERPSTTWPKWIVTGGGLGFLRPAPGSWGTAGPALLFWLLLVARVSAPARNLIAAAIAVVSAVLLLAFGKWACAYFAKPDPGQVVLDEFAGFFITTLFVPAPPWFHRGIWHTWLFVAILFVLFRLTDTLKIPPGRQLEQLPFGYGILLDDIAAGIQANIVAQLLFRFVHF